MLTSTPIEDAHNIPCTMGANEMIISLGIL
jgi:hypothetical protein